MSRSDDDGRAQNQLLAELAAAHNPETPIDHGHNKATNNDSQSGAAPVTFQLPPASTIIEPESDNGSQGLTKDTSPEEDIAVNVTHLYGLDVTYRGHV